MKSTEKIYKKSCKMVKSLILDVFKDENVTIILFGSRAKGNSYDNSDIDIGILPENGYDKTKLTLSREKLEKLNIPYKVDLVDISEFSKSFRDNVLKYGEIWKK
jgi:predicted nucleotidyltransferase